MYSAAQEYISAGGQLGSSCGGQVYFFRQKASCGGQLEYCVCSCLWSRCLLAVRTRRVSAAVAIPPAVVVSIVRRCLQSSHRKHPNCQ